MLTSTLCFVQEGGSSWISGIGLHPPLIRLLSAPHVEDIRPRPVPQRPPSVLANSAASRTGSLVSTSGQNCSKNGIGCVIPHSWLPLAEGMVFTQPVTNCLSAAFHKTLIRSCKTLNEATTIPGHDFGLGSPMLRCHQQP